MTDTDALLIPPDLTGLSEQDAARERARVGPNRWVPTARWARVRDALELLLDPMAVMLAIAALIYVAVGETRDALVLAVALIPVLGVDVVLDARSRAALAKLAQAAAPEAEVLRGAHLRAVPLEDVVPGDLLVLREGHTVAADGIILWTANLSIDESSLTGESVPQLKRIGDENGVPPAESCFFAGSVVTSGHGFGRVVSTGPSTRYGGIAALVARTAASPSPLQRRAGDLARRFGIVAVIVAVALAAVSVWRGDSWEEALLGAVSLAMAAIPEEFPLVLTSFLAVGAYRLAARGMLVRHLTSVETLGSTTVICTDKTGTLTRGEFQMTDHVVLEPSLTAAAFLEAAVLACERHPADAMERAILGYAAHRGVPPSMVGARWTLVRDYDFDAAGKHMSHVWQRSDGPHAYLIAAKGAVEGVLAHSSADAATRARVLDANEGLARRGLRVLAVAARRTDRLGSSREDDERDLTIFGLLGFQDPLRPEVPDAVRDCQRAGIRIKMITGDHALTAHAVAEAAGILHEDDAIVTGEDLVALTSAEGEERIARAAIFARIGPEQKFLIVDALRRRGAIVAMTGDGVNDAAALRRADIGIAMGQRGTDVARATADLVLLDDNFASIVATVREGRHIFENLQSAFLYLIAFHLPIVALAIVAPLAGVPLVLLPIHLVWLELIVHPVSAIVFQSEPATASVMTRPPRDPAAPLLPRAAVLRSATAGAVLATVTFTVFWRELPAVGEPMARGLALVVLIAGYQALVFVERLALNRSVARVPRTWVFWIVWIASAASVIAILGISPVASLFRVAMPDGVRAAMAAAAGVAAIAWRLYSDRGGRPGGGVLV